MRMRSRAEGVTPLIAAAGAIIALILSASGCYKRVVGVEGPGSEAYDVYEPNLKMPEDSLSDRPGTVPNKTVPTKKAKE